MSNEGYSMLNPGSANTKMIPDEVLDTGLSESLQKALKPKKIKKHVRRETKRLAAAAATKKQQ